MTFAMPAHCTGIAWVQIPLKIPEPEIFQVRVWDNCLSCPARARFISSIQYCLCTKQIEGIRAGNVRALSNWAVSPDQPVHKWNAQTQSCLAKLTLFRKDHHFMVISISLSSTELLTRDIYGLTAVASKLWEKISALNGFWGWNLYLVFLVNNMADLSRLVFQLWGGRSPRKTFRSREPTNLYKCIVKWNIE